LLKLARHPEGGWFSEVYRADGTIPQASLPEGFSGERQFSTAIYCLLCETAISALHRLRRDEIWHFYDGAALTIHVVDSAGGARPSCSGVTSRRASN